MIAGCAVSNNTIIAEGFGISCRRLRQNNTAYAIGDMITVPEGLPELSVQPRWNIGQFSTGDVYLRPAPGRTSRTALRRSAVETIFPCRLLFMGPISITQPRSQAPP